MAKINTMIKLTLTFILLSNQLAWAHDERTVEYVRSKTAANLTRQEFEGFINSQGAFLSNTMGFFGRAYPVVAILGKVKDAFEKKYFMYPKTFERIYEISATSNNDLTDPYDFNGLATSYLVVFLMAKHGFMDKAQERADRNLKQILAFGSYLVSQYSIPEDVVQEMLADHFAWTLYYTLVEIDNSKPSETQNLHALLRYISKTYNDIDKIEGHRRELAKQSAKLSTYWGNNGFIKFAGTLGWIAGIAASLIGYIATVNFRADFSLWTLLGFSLVAPAAAAAGVSISKRIASIGNYHIRKIYDLYRLKIKNIQPFVSRCEEMMTESGEILPVLPEPTISEEK